MLSALVIDHEVVSLPAYGAITKTSQQDLLGMCSEKPRDGQRRDIRRCLAMTRRPGGYLPASLIRCMGPDGGHAFLGAYMMVATPSTHTNAPITSYRSGQKSIDDHSPGKGTCDEDTPISGEDAAEVRVVLQRCAETVEAQADDPGADPEWARCSRTPCQTSHAPLISADSGQDEQCD